MPAVAEAEANLQDVRSGSRPAEISQTEAAVEAARAQVRDAEARLDLAENDLNRSRQLLRTGGHFRNELESAQRERRSAEAGLEQAQAQGWMKPQRRLEDVRNLPEPEVVAQAEARLAQAGAQLQATQVRLSDNSIRAPFAGIITQKFATEGAFCNADHIGIRAILGDFHGNCGRWRQDLEILAEVPEADISLIEPNQKVEIIADAFPEQTFEGRVKLIAPEAIERQNVTLFQVRIELLSGKDVLRSNMNVDVQFIGDQLQNALVVPTVGCGHPGRRDGGAGTR